ncbi:hypothetical protein JUJ52_02925 [Virgibacillus sp. AGTR]|uniref:hypothetical protein n=1 Tax=Virgibacillus sp. AGTR TaxID=2812055 RepID=UPI001D16EA4B|nr:hypothetical protein [Virgibacillus sp. AGTR]MCC2248910.1 hypothetical protein [Virgibacillus sp. AGTR]
MTKPISINGTLWRCIDEHMKEFGMTCIVIDGEVRPDYNGDNDIKIKYEDDSIAFMKFRRFATRFKRIKPTDKGANKQSRCRPFFF